MQARAVVAVEPYRIEVQNVEIPEMGADDVQVRVVHSWISNGTEGSFVRGERIAGDTPRSDTDPLPFPHVPGYQKVGVVEEVGANVSKVQPGDSVFVTVSRVAGMFFDFAGHISPSVSHQSQVWKLPSTLEPIVFSGMVLTQVGVNMGMRPTLEPGDAAVVIGDGMVGHWAAQTLQYRGAAVLMLGKHDDRLNRFERTQNDAVVNITRENPLDAIRAWRSDRIQVLADSVGSVAFVESLFPLMKRFSHLVSAGFHGHDGRIDIQKMRDFEMTLHAPAGWTAERMDSTLDLLTQEVITTTHLITHRFPVERAAEAFDLILSRRDGVLGVVLDWEE